MRRSPALLALLLLAAGLGPPAALAAAASAAPAGSYLLAGGEAAWLFDPGRGARSFTAEALFHPDAVGQFSARLARLRLGLCLRYQHRRVVDLLDTQGLEIALRHLPGPAGRPLTPFVELGLGELRLAYEDGGARSSWTAVLGAGVERALGERWLLAAALHLRSLEVGERSLSHLGFGLTVGGRIDA